MISLLIAVLILGVVAWVIMQSPIPPFFKTVAYAILAIILIVLFANALGYGPNLSLR